IGETIDDAVGEAFDKAAKVMGLPYPGGPVIDRLAKDGDPKTYSFAASRVPGYDFSFSGVKTSFLYFIRAGQKEDPRFVEKNLADICASYQQHLVSLLLRQARQVIRDRRIRQFALAGGVSANSLLRGGVRAMEKELGIRTYVPPFEYCTDNAAM